MIRATFLIFLSIFFISCSSKVQNLDSRIQTAFVYANKNNLNDEIIHTNNFDLFSLQNKNSFVKN